MDIQIRKCTLDDLPLLQTIATETYNETYSHLNTPENMNDYLENAFNSTQLKKELSNESSTFLFLYTNEVLAGYLKVNEGEAQTFEVGENALEIERIYVKEKFHDRGLGKTLLKKGFEIAKEKDKSELWLGVWQKNTNAVAFHKSMGFEVKGEYSFFIGDEEETNYIMVKSLK
ncbi:GNAT family N-acetyltransferase [Saliterribacillus persicus]|uniref:Ribosomal protein S18 acetylase RimI-like enzyme n=1 Tax=Saliterribacillus persicus TaxID=930114 RepID=A0A368Y1M0_9BACI|nr:N-acetyltransferase [Saliterribacillus persicus]RCW73256.1 ribosomal protein S18 acetylase RimI-like enzyme [Saliterribacillus persicus]